MNNVNKITNQIQLNNVTSKATNSTSTNFSSYLGESKSLDEIFQTAADKYNVNVNLLKSIGKAESDFREKVVSRSGAVGIMQLMPATAKYLGVDDSYDAEQNIMGGAKYIRELLDKYNGDTTLALAAYNAGPGNVSKYGGVPPFEETRNYVTKIHNYMKNDIQTGILVQQNASTITSNTVNNSMQIMNPIYANTNFDETVEEASKSLYIDELFSYDKYLEFLDLYMKFLDMDQTTRENENKYENTSTYQSLNYSAPVLNLLNKSK